MAADAADVRHPVSRTAGHACAATAQTARPLRAETARLSVLLDQQRAPLAVPSTVASVCPAGSPTAAPRTAAAQPLGDQPAQGVTDHEPVPLAALTVADPPISAYVSAHAHQLRDSRSRTTSVAAAGDPLTKPKNGPKSCVAEKPVMYSPSRLV